MPASRKVPDFHSPGAIDSFIAGVSVVPFVLVFLFIILSDHAKSFRDWVGLLLAIIFEFLLIYIHLTSIYEGLKNLEKKRAWKSDSATALTTIVKREGNVRYTDYYYKYGPFWTLYLEMTSDQKEKSPGEVIITANISKRLYKKYTGKDSILIYYSPSDPQVFLVKGEI